LLYNTADMSGSGKIAGAVLMTAAFAALTACAGPPAAKPLVDPFPLRFPLVEAGRVPIDGHIVGQPRLRDGILYYATREGRLTALVVRSLTVLWRFETESPISAGPELAGDLLLVRDDGGALYGLAGPDGRVALEIALGPAAAIPALPRLIDGELLLATAEGNVRRLALDGREIGAYRLPVAEARVTAGPVAVDAGGGHPAAALFGLSDGRLLAVDRQGAPVWEFRGAGAIAPEPVASGGRVYFGTDARRFYCLGAGKGRKKWSRRLQGSPVQAALMVDGRVVVAASNSVVYVLSGRGGSIISWEPMASRLLYEPASAGAYILAACASPGIKALNMRTGAKAEVHPTSDLLAGALSCPPYVVIFEEDPDSGLQRLVLLTSRPPAPSSRGKK
jgi:hypothetical protein